MPQVGRELTVDIGKWSGRPHPRFQFSWLRDGLPIPGEHGAKYTLAADDIGAMVAASITATNNHGSAPRPAPRSDPSPRKLQTWRCRR
jgi:hypothetical protein